MVCLKEELFRMSNLSSWVSVYLSEGSLSLFDVLGLVCCFFFLFFCLYSAATCILHVYFVCLLQVLLIYLLCLPIKKHCILNVFESILCDYVIMQWIMD